MKKPPNTWKTTIVTEENISDSTHFIYCSDTFRPLPEIYKVCDERKAEYLEQITKILDSLAELDRGVKEIEENA